MSKFWSPIFLFVLQYNGVLWPCSFISLPESFLLRDDHGNWIQKHFHNVKYIYNYLIKGVRSVEMSSSYSPCLTLLKSFPGPPVSHTPVLFGLVKFMVPPCTLINVLSVKFNDNTVSLTIKLTLLHLLVPAIKCIVTSTYLLFTRTFTKTFGLQSWNFPELLIIYILQFRLSQIPSRPLTTLIVMVNCICWAASVH